MADTAILTVKHDELLDKSIYQDITLIDALFCRWLTGVSDALTGRFRQANRELDAVWRYGIAQTASGDVSKSCQTTRRRP